MSQFMVCPLVDEIPAGMAKDARWASREPAPAPRRVLADLVAATQAVAVDLHAVTDAQLAKIGLRHRLVAAVVEANADEVSARRFIRGVDVRADPHRSHCAGQRRRIFGAL